MAQGKKAPHVPNESECISQKEAAKALNVTAPAVTVWKKSGRYRGFYDFNGTPKVYLPELIESRIANAIAENGGDGTGGSDIDEQIKEFQREKEKAAARKVIRSDQIEDGKTIYVDDIVMGFDEICSAFRAGSKSIAPALSQTSFEFMSNALLASVAGEQELVEAVSEALSRIDTREYASFLKEKINGQLGPIGDKIVEVIPKAIERSRKA